jgi:hypothetical protein
MMLDDFQKQIARLTSTYGDKAYPPERVQILWAQLRHCQVDDMRAAVSAVIADSPRAPMAKDLAEAVEQAARRRRDVEASGTGELPKCRYCWDQGWVVTRRTGPSLGTALRCCCAAGRARLRTIPQFRPEHHDPDDFELPPWHHGQQVKAPGGDDLVSRVLRVALGKPE